MLGVGERLAFRMMPCRKTKSDSLGSQGSVIRMVTRLWYILPLKELIKLTSTNCIGSIEPFQENSDAVSLILCLKS